MTWKKRNPKKKKYSGKKKQALQTSKKFEIKIEDLNEKGEGIAFHNGRKLKIPKTLPGENLIVEYLLYRPPKDRLHLLKILESSPDRVPPLCKFFEECGGCHLQHLKYEKQLQFKQNLIKKQLLKFPDIRKMRVLPVAGMEEPFHYRNKCQMPFQRQGNNIIYGLFRSGTHEVIPIDYCPVENRDANQVLKIVKEWAQYYQIPIYDEMSHEGFLRHVVIRKGFFTNQLMVVLVVTGEDIPHWKELLNRLNAELSALNSFQLNINPSRTNRILGDRNILISGEPFILERLGRFRFQIFPHTFFQVNSVQTIRLLESLITIAHFNSEAVVADLYSGVGTIGIYISPFVKKVIGVEENAHSVEAARQNAKNNQISNLEFREGDVTQIFQQLIEAGEPIQTVIVDPPRKGLDRKLIKLIGRSDIESVIYISCNPKTLVRDLAFLYEEGFTGDEILPFDMFPQTYHVESLMILRR